MHAILSFTGGRNKNLQTTMARSDDIRRVQREQRDAMDTIQYYSRRCYEVLQRFEFCSRHDQYDLHDNLHTIYIPSQLFSRQIRK